MSSTMLSASLPSIEAEAEAYKAFIIPMTVVALVLASRLSTPEQKCVGWPEQKYIGDAGRKAPNWGPFLRASGLGRIIHRGVSTGAA